MSLKQDPTKKLDQDYVVWEGKFKDGTGAKAVYVNGAILSMGEEGNAILWFYNEEQEGYLALQHITPTTPFKDEEEYLNKLIETIDDGTIEFSDLMDHQGRMKYKYVTFNYQKNGIDLSEIVMVSIDENGDIWFVDLYGTPEDVEDQEKNLVNLVWSLQPTWD